MRKYLVLFCIIIFSVSYAQADWIVPVEEREEDWRRIMEEVEERRRRPTSDWIRMDNERRDKVWEYYYHLLLKEWLKNADQQELWPRYSNQIGTTDMCRSSEVRDSTDSILKERYNITNHLNIIDKNIGKTTSMGSRYKHWLARVGELPEKEQVWILITRNSKRAISYKDKIDELDWEKINLAELRDNNAYSFFLRKLAFDSTYRCPFPQKSISATISSGSVDSTRALTIAAATAAKCHGVEMTPIAARLMGANKEHWLVYCFAIFHASMEEQKGCYEIFTNRYKNGHYLWNMRGDPCFARASMVVSVLISRKTGRVLFMD